MKRYEQVPDALALDRNLSLGARATYPVLRHLAWKAGRDSADDAVELPSLDSIAETLGVAASTLKTYISELRAAGWVETRRASRRRPSLYVIRDERESRISADSTPRVSRIPDDSDGLSLVGPDRGRRERPNGLSAAPPFTKVDGRNLAWDALVRACSLDARNRAQRGRLAAALRDIRRYAWDDLTPSARDVLDAAEFERFVAAEVERRARLYRERMPRATLTPTALSAWWHQVEVAPPDPLAEMILEAETAER